MSETRRKMVYRVMDPTTGLYVKKHNNLSSWSWTATGSFWGSLGHVKNALQHTLKDVLKKCPDARVVEFLVEERWNASWDLAHEAAREPKK